MSSDRKRSFRCVVTAFALIQLWSLPALAKQLALVPLPPAGVARARADAQQAELTLALARRGWQVTGGQQGLDQLFDAGPAAMFRAARLAEFAKLDTAEAWFNRGNALAHLERYEEAMEAYQRALELRPDYPWAQANLEYIEVFQPLELEGGEMGTVGRDAAADEIVFDADQQRLEEEGIDTVMEEGQEVISDQQLAEIWLRPVDTSPSSFLRYKFAYQAQSSGEEEDR